MPEPPPDVQVTTEPIEEGSNETNDASITPLKKDSESQGMVSTKPKTALKKTLKMPSLKNLHELASVEEQPEDYAENQELNERKEIESFTEKDLLKYWKEFALTRREAGKENQYVILSQAVKLKEDNSIHLILTSSIQVEMLDDMKTDLIQFLRGKLRNDLISITYEITEEKIDARPYTQHEKYEFLVAKQPALKKLKEALGLDYEF